MSKLNIIIPELDITESTKADLLKALKEKGKNIDENVPLSSYPDYISSIKPGVGTAQPNQVLKGTTFTNQIGDPLVGTIPIITSQAFHIKSTDQLIPANSYIDGTLVFNTDTNIKPENIVYGKKIAGVSGSMLTNAGVRRKSYSTSAFTGNIVFDRPIVVYAIILKTLYIKDRHYPPASTNYTLSLKIGNIFEITNTVAGAYHSGEAYCQSVSSSKCVKPFVDNGSQYISIVESEVTDPGRVATDPSVKIKSRTEAVSPASSFEYSIRPSSDIELIDPIAFDILYKEV